MNQSKWQTVRIPLFLFITIITFVLLCTPYFPEPSGAGMSADAVGGYTKCIETGVVSNWHSALFVYECIGIKNFIYFLTGNKLTGPEVIYVVWVVLSVCMVVFTTILGCRIAEQNYWKALMFLCCVFVFTKVFPDLYPIGLDYFFLCLLWCFVVLLVEYTCSNSNRRKYCFLLPVVILLFHLVSYRKNSILLAPLAIGYLLYKMDWFKSQKSITKFMAWSGIVLVFVALAMTWESAILNIKKTHPTTPMMESEVRIAAVLRGEQDAFRRHGYHSNNKVSYSVNNMIAEKAITAFWFIPRFKTNQEWLQYRSIYINEWKVNAETMLAAWIIQRIQFYSGGHNFPFLKNAVEKRYPIIKENKHAWETPGPLVHDSPLKRIFWLCFTPICFLIALYTWKKRIIDSVAGVVTALCSSSSFLYSISYIIVVPTSDARYLAPSYMLALFSVSMLGVALITALVKRCQFALVQWK